MSTMEKPWTGLTPEDLLALPGREQYELVDGHLVERTVSALSSMVAARLIQQINNFCERQQLAWAFGPDCGYRCFPDDPGKVRRADASYVRRERLPVERLAEGYVTIAPDLAAEVVSPHDTAYELEAKVQDYLAAGVPLVWVVYPPTRTVHVHRADGSTVLLRENDEILGEEILAGFRCRVGDLFPAALAGAGPVL